MKRNQTSLRAKHFCMFIMLLFLYIGSDAQYYYGAPPPPPGPRRSPANNPGGNDAPNTSEPSGYLSLNLGLALPEQSFATEIGSGYGGYAQPGSVYNLSFAFPINHSNFGIALMFGNYGNSYDLDTYVNNLNYANTNTLSEAVYPDNNFYSATSIMGGLYFTYPIGRLSIDGRLMIGALLCSLPEQDYASEDAAGNIFQYDLQSSNTTGLAGDVGIGLRYLILRLARRPLCAMINVDYLLSNPTYNTEQIVYETPATNNPYGQTYQLVPSPTASGHLPISLLTISLGLGYQFGGK